MTRCIKGVAALFLAMSVQAGFAATVEPAKAESAKAATPTAELSKGDPSNAQPSTSKSTKAETAKADENRKKPLQRCDELADKAQQDCLQKARQRIVEARKKREASGGKEADGQKASIPPKDPARANTAQAR